MKEIENPMVIDALWDDSYSNHQKVIGECEGCGCEILLGEEVFDYNGELIHAKYQCCYDYINVRSR